jgi:hypothetical protein
MYGHENMYFGMKMFNYDVFINTQFWYSNQANSISRNRPPARLDSAHRYYIISFVVLCHDTFPFLFGGWPGGVGTEHRNQRSAADDGATPLRA